MLIFAIDDEPKMLRLLSKAIKEAAPEAEVRDFPLGSAAIAAIKEEKLYPNVIFTDIAMPRPDGLELAIQLKTLVPNTKIVFVTGYGEYAVEAFRIHASGYVMKPIELERIKEELNNAVPYMSDNTKLRVRCFGYFEVFWKGLPLAFSRKQSKELFAFLVDRRGAVCTSEEVIAALWEEDGNLKNAKQNIRNFVSDIKSTLKAINMGSVLIRQGSTLAVRTDLLDCDFYRMLKGDISALNEFRGEYMEQYSWAELTKSSLFWRKQSGR